MTITYKKLISTLLIVLVAVLTGLVIGKLYLDANTAKEGSKLSWAEAHTPLANVEVLYEKSQKEGAKVTDFTAKELYLIAEYKLSLGDFTIETTGIIDSGVMGISAKVNMRSVKTKEGDKITYSKFSPPVDLAVAKTPKICKQFVYEPSKKGVDGKPYVSIIEGEFSSTTEKIDGTFSGKGETWSEDDYVARFKAMPDKTILPYIISDVTYNGTPEITYNAETDDYSFRLALNGHDVLRDATLCYTEEIAYTCGYGNANLTWSNAVLDIIIGSDFNFKSINYDEYYVLYATGLPTGVPSANVNDKFFSSFTVREVG